VKESELTDVKIFRLNDKQQGEFKRWFTNDRLYFE
jgi:hypothetical protein